MRPRKLLLFRLLLNFFNNKNFITLLAIPSRASRTVMTSRNDCLQEDKREGRETVIGDKKNRLLFGRNTYYDKLNDQFVNFKSIIFLYCLVLGILVMVRLKKKWKIYTWKHNTITQNIGKCNFLHSSFLYKLFLFECSL